MATAAESAYAAAVNKAAGVKQNSYAIALAAYAPNGFGVFANLPTYQAAIVTADVAFMVSVNSAATTNCITPWAVDDQLQFYPSFERNHPDMTDIIQVDPPLGAADDLTGQRWRLLTPRSPSW